MAIKISGSTIIDDDRNIVNAGVITATSFSGDGSGLSGVGIGSDGNINTSGIITASTISANEFVGTGDKLIFSPTITSFVPTDGSTDIALDTNIVLTFDQTIYAGVGSIFLRDSSPDVGIGTEIEAIGITSSMISNQTLTITPSSLLPINTDVYVVLPQGVVKNVLNGGINSISTYNFTTVDFSLASLDPSNGATNVGVDTSITLTFTSPPSRGTGTIQIKHTSSSTGTLIESFDAATSPRITIDGNKWILTPTSSFTDYLKVIYPIIPNDAITGFVGLNTTGADSYSFTLADIPLGTAYEGGYLICQSGGTRWIIAPSSSEVQRTWYSRNDAVTQAQSVSGCSGWFVPTCGQMYNPGYLCRQYWDSYTAESRYWTNTEAHSPTVNAWVRYFTIGHANYIPKNITARVRAMRTVSY